MPDFLKRTYYASLEPSELLRAAYPLVETELEVALLNALENTLDQLSEEHADDTPLDLNGDNFDD